MRIFAIICIVMSMYMVVYVFYDISNNVDTYAHLYDTLTQMVVMTKITIINLIVIVLSLTLFKRRYV
jgi:hypothetical protein